jgi:hypothetical protein
MKFVILSLKVAAVIQPLVSAVIVNISNTEVRHDVNGNLMDTHDGSIS